MEENYMELDIREYFMILLKRKWLIIFITLTSVAISALVSFCIIKPVYESRVSIIIGKDEAKVFYEDRYTQSDILMYEKLAKTYAEIAKSSRVIQKTAEKLEKYSVSFIRNSMSVTPQGDTQILSISVKTNDPELSAAIANELAKNFIDESGDVLPAGNLNILDKAEASYSPVSPKKMLNISIAFFLGIMISIGIIFLLEYIDNTIKNEEDVSHYLDLPVLISIPEY